MRCSSCGQENPDGFRFCGNCGAPVDGAARTAVEERKVVTVLFCDLVGFTARSDQADPEDVRALLRPYHVRLRQEIERLGGTVDKFIGDGVMAVFGVPNVHEDDPERAVRCALRVLDAIAELNQATPELELAVRIGVMTGEAAVILDPRPHETEGVVGDVVNTASRLQGVAPTGSGRDDVLLAHERGGVHRRGVGVRRPRAGRVAGGGPRCHGGYFGSRLNCEVDQK